MRAQTNFSNAFTPNELSAKWPSSTVRRLQIQRDEFDSRLEPIVFGHRVVADSKEKAFFQSEFVFDGHQGRDREVVMGTIVLLLSHDLLFVGTSESRSITRCLHEACHV